MWNIFEQTPTLQDDKMTGLPTAATSIKSPKKKKKKTWLETSNLDAVKFCGSIRLRFEEMVVVNTYQVMQPRDSDDVFVVL